MIEFAFILPLMLTLGFAAVEFGHALTQYSVLASATEEGLRSALRTDGLAKNTVAHSVITRPVIGIGFSFITSPDPATQAGHLSTHQKIATMLTTQDRDRRLSFDSVRIESEFLPIDGGSPDPKNDSVRVRVATNYQAIFPSFLSAILWFVNIDELELKTEAFGPYLASDPVF